MSGCSYSVNCPNCSESVDAYTDHKPFDFTSIGPCVHCGFYTDVSVKYLDLEELNNAREEWNENYGDEEDPLPKLKKLPEQERF